MSDDEDFEPGMGGDMGMGGMGGMDDDFSDDDGDMGDYNPPPELPDGVSKEIVTEAGAGIFKKPKKGDEVAINYVGTLESDGSEFDSCKDKLFKFILGEGKVIKGLDLGVATMKMGETSKFTIKPEFGYQFPLDSTAPQGIPENATLVYEVTLDNFITREDLFSDGGVIKSTMKEGEGWKKPGKADEVLVSYKVTCEDKVVEEKANFEYQMGAEFAGKLSVALDKALAGMKKGEECTLECDEKYGSNDKRTIVDLALHQIYFNTDVSFQKNKTVMKKCIKEGEGYETAKDTAKVEVLVKDVTSDNKSILNGGEQKVEFCLGNGEQCDVLECACLEMKKGEEAIVTCTLPELAVDEKLGLPEGITTPIAFKLEMVAFDKAKEKWNMSESEKIEFATKRKDIGGELFKRKRVRLAMERYKGVIGVFDYIDNYKDEDSKTKAKAMKLVCELNKAMCALKLGDALEAKQACTTVLKDERNNVKALFRRASASIELKDYEEAISDIKRLLEIEPKNVDARQLYQKAAKLQKEVDKKCQGMYAKMCSGFGKGKSTKTAESVTADKTMECDADETGEKAAEAGA